MNELETVAVVAEVVAIQPKLDIHAILKVKEALEMIAIEGISALADGKINLLDLDHGMNILKGIPLIAEACGEIKEVMPEFKDIDQVELMECLAAMYEMIKKIIEAYKMNKPVVA